MSNHALHSYWKALVQLPTIEGWDGEPATEEGHTIYPIIFEPLNQVIINFNLLAIEEFSCTDRFKQKFTAHFDTEDHYITTYPITDVSYHRRENVQTTALPEQEFRILFGRYSGDECIHLLDSTPSCIVEKGDTVWFLFEIAELDRFKLLGVTSNPDPQINSEISANFLKRLAQFSSEFGSTNPQRKRQYFITGLQQILWRLADSPRDWSLAIWITHIGLRMYAWDLVETMDFEDAAEYDINNITFENAFYVK